MSEYNRSYIVAVDFDKTLAGHAPWTGVQTAPLEPHPVVANLIRRLHSEGYTIMIWTCRNQNALVEQYCDDFNIPIHGVNVGLHPTFDEGSPKAYADVYLDDKGMHYSGEETEDELYNEIVRRREEWLKEGEC